ncbi:hypothetical protein TRFO_19811 [Tritrichomonas foetus]|uniref:Uncharacterized protein n=1 Tax=Tritrichomonas foetus TaxID=1144522 RepID=A0A1J4KM00_9EUKA|nr:hypothetical protein TRFO_19811 [Tritrichomonas foetus]|eukprot:OHT10828.1 hypothetical protein TRFO_19811 [Tritrichomonas foetus]
MLTVTYTYHPEKIIEIETKKESQFSVEADLMLTDSDSDNQDEKISNIDNKIPKYPPIPNTNIRNSYILKRKDATILSEDDLYSISKEKSSASVKHSHDETNEDTKDINHENDSEEVLLKKRAQSKTVKNHKTLPSPSPPSIINNTTNPPVTPPEGLPSDTHLNYPLFEVLHVYYVINDHEYDIPLNNALRTDLGTILTNSKNSTVYWKIEFRNRRKSGNISFSTKTKRNFLVKDQKNRYNWLDFPGQAETFTVMTRASQMKAGKIKLSGKVFNPENVTECYRIKASFILKKM